MRNGYQGCCCLVFFSIKFDMCLLYPFTFLLAPFFPNLFHATSQAENCAFEIGLGGVEKVATGLHFRLLVVLATCVTPKLLPLALKKCLLLGLIPFQGRVWKLLPKDFDRQMIDFDWLHLSIN